jgi:hypothetical protein
LPASRGQSSRLASARQKDSSGALDSAPLDNPHEAGCDEMEKSV